MFLTFSAVLSGSLGWKDIKQFGDEKLEWLRQFREFKNGIPVDDTIARVVSCLKSDEFNQCFMNWVNAVRQENNQPQIAIDGKTLRHFFTEKPIDALHSITAWHAESGLVLAQMKSSGKKNENASVLEILNALNINGAHITVDTMNTQKTIATKITKGGADYTMCVKDNHKNFKQQIAAYFHKVQRDTRDLIKTITTVDSRHGRIGTRTCEQLQANEWIEDLEDWSEVRVVIKITREQLIKKSGLTETETLYYISTRNVPVEEALKIVRLHCGMQNRLHWILDVTLNEEQSGVHDRISAKKLILLRRMRLNLLRITPLLEKNTDYCKNNQICI